MASFLMKLIPVQNIKLAFWIFIALLSCSLMVYTAVGDENSSGKNIFQDTDQDGLSNDEEKTYGTDPQKKDTDGDSYSDGAEVESGYNPLKPAPGDRIISEEEGRGGIPDTETTTKASSEDSGEGKNLTNEFSQEIGGLITSLDPNNPQVSLDQITSAVQKTLNQETLVEDLPEVDTKNIKVKKQRYSSLSEEEKKAQIKEDSLEYLTATTYIIANNLPTSIHSLEDLRKLARSMSLESTSALTAGKTQYLDDLAEKGSQVLSQIEDIEVPENMLDTHIQSLQLFQYATTIKDKMKPDVADPLASIVSVGKAQTFLNTVTQFVVSTQEKLEAYNITEIPLEL